LAATVLRLALREWREDEDEVAVPEALCEAVLAVVLECEVEAATCWVLAPGAVGLVLMAAMSGEAESSAAEATKTAALTFFDENINAHLYEVATPR
jgi:hypothetical protein